MKGLLKYLMLTLVFAMLSSGAVIAAFLDSCSESDYTILWLILPMTLFFLSAVAVNDRWAAPRLLMRGQYAVYFIVIAAVAYSVSYIALGAEYFLRDWLEIPQRIRNFASPWVALDVASSCMLLLMILLGLGLERLYRHWRSEAEEEQQLSVHLTKYIAIVRQRLNPGAILESFTRISHALSTVPSEANAEIRRLSGWLRQQLYELPPPPTFKDFSRTDNSSAITSLLVGRRYRLMRHIFFQFLLVLISLTSFFRSPDNPDFSAGQWGGFLSVFILLDILAYINYFWLFRRFRRSGNVKRYAMEVGILLLLLIIPMIAAQILTYEENVYDKSLPWGIMLISTLGSVFTLLLYMGGVSAVLVLQEWVRGQWRVSKIKAEAVRQEYAYLRKQINPHFLFNVLNNIGILSAEDPTEAAEMLGQLRQLLEYQFEETDHEWTTVGREADFLRNYLTLQASRIEPFEYEIEVESGLKDARIPTLLYITLVENAVKYSGIVNGRRGVRVCISEVLSRIEFKCCNTYVSRDEESRRLPGIGLNNTRRRLQLLYGDNFNLTHSIENSEYTATLTIPKYELHNR